ncbi:MAG: hypothetical protein IPK17_38435 [Chloroflexi bacterium]|uniref:hypothetical protein n=1 Tax=Candidatus Flexifilum breve TaxID=3140694 RepID=UPI003134FECE|nr:hypothetical protein [Chloroflexota bacterium]
MSIPTIEQLEQQKQSAHYRTSKRLGELNDEAARLQTRLQQIQTEGQQVQDAYRIEDARYDAQIELLKELEAKP